MLEQTTWGRGGCRGCHSWSHLGDHVLVTHPGCQPLHQPAGGQELVQAQGVHYPMDVIHPPGQQEQEQEQEQEQDQEQEHIPPGHKNKQRAAHVFHLGVSPVANHQPDNLYKMSDCDFLLGGVGNPRVVVTGGVVGQGAR